MSRIPRCAALLAALLPFPALTAPVFVNGIAIPAATADKFGTTANTGRLGFFSDIYFDPNRGQWWGLSDRGPGGGTLPYDTRVQQFRIDIDATTGAISNFAVAETVKFRSDGTIGGVPAGFFNGIAPGTLPASSSTGVLGLALDPEGFVVNPRNGNFIVSDEYGPSVYEFTRDGVLARVYATPGNLIPRDGPTGVPNFASDTDNEAGKRTNRGFEGLAISPDGRYVYAMLQSAMLDEGAGNGTFNRIVKFDTETGLAVAQYAYAMAAASQGRGISALVALDDNRMLVLERNNRGVGVGAEFATQNKKVFEIDLTGATNVAAIPIAGGVLPAGVIPVSKVLTPFLDLGANTLAALGNKVPEKWEGLAVGPRLNDGSYLLLAGTDNDYSVTQNGSNVQFDVYFRFSDANPYATSIQCPLDTKIGCTFTTGGGAATLTDSYALLPGVLHAYRASTTDLGGYVAPIPVPGTLLLLGLGIVGLALPRMRSR
jgi:hypothetical protein